MKIIKNKWFWLLVIAIGGGVWYMRSRPEAPQYEFVKAQRGTVTEIVDVTGEVEPVQYADLSFLVSGTVEKVLVEVGDEVHIGDTLSVLDTSILESEIAQARAKASIIEEDEKLSRRNWKLLKPEEREAKKLASEQARANVSALLAQRASFIVKSPIEGIVSQVDIRVGERVAPSQKIIRIISGNIYQIRTDVPESDVSKIHIGQEGVATFDAFDSDDTFPVRLIDIEPEARQIQDVVYYTAHFEILREDNRLRSGMSSDIEIRTAESQNVLKLPIRAIHEENGRKFVEMLSGNDVVQRDVRLGIEDDRGNREVLSGLADEEVVIVRISGK